MFYGAIDVGGTKTLVAIFNQDGDVVEKQKFPTPSEYPDFLEELKKTLEILSNHDFQAFTVAMPGSVDHKHGLVHAFGNLSWRDVHVIADLEKIIHCPVLLENDAKLAGLSEAVQVPEYEKVLYITISTGIGTGLIVGGQIDRALDDSEGGQMMLEHDGRLQKWESFASGKAIVARYGKRAADLDDPEAWRALSRDFASGILALVAIMQPDAVIIGGGAGSHFDKFGDYLRDELKKYETPMVPIPPVLPAKNPEEAVIYGCYKLARQTYAHDRA
jgi:predicted NBD/HSP70 family sugar kinase